MSKGPMTLAQQQAVIAAFIANISLDCIDGDPQRALKLMQAGELTHQLRVWMLNQGWNAPQDEWNLSALGYPEEATRRMYPDLDETKASKPEDLILFPGRLERSRELVDDLLDQSEGDERYQALIREGDLRFCIGLKTLEGLVKSDNKKICSHLHGLASGKQEIFIVAWRSVFQTRVSIGDFTLGKLVPALRVLFKGECGSVEIEDKTIYWKNLSDSAVCGANSPVICTQRPYLPRQKRYGRRRW